MDSKLLLKIERRNQEGTIRSLSSFEGKIDFFSNDYLGLSKVKTQNYNKEYFGSTGSRLISGSNSETESCEDFIAHFFESESAIVFNSGYDANLGFFSCIPQKGDTVLYDEYIHASIRDGLRLSFANSFPFKHNDIVDLKKKIQKAKGTIYVSIESLYSMDGDIAPIKDILSICNMHHAFLVVDEAHACGVFGDNGKGIVHELGIQNDVFARLITFGKAFGSHGAAIVCRHDLKKYLVNFSRPFIYTTALPPESFFRISSILAIDTSDERLLLNQNIEYFRKVFKDFVIESNEKSPIQLLRFSSVELMINLVHKLSSANLAVKPIFTPTVPINNQGIRVCIHSFNNFQQIDLFKSIVL